MYTSKPSPFGSLWKSKPVPAESFKQDCRLPVNLNDVSSSVFKAWKVWVLLLNFVPPHTSVPWPGLGYSRPGWCFPCPWLFEVLYVFSFIGVSCKQHSWDCWDRDCSLKVSIISFRIWICPGLIFTTFGHTCLLKQNAIRFSGILHRSRVRGKIKPVKIREKQIFTYKSARTRQGESCEDFFRGGHS